MTYAVEGYDVNYYKNEKSVVVLGSGAYRIGSSVAFDWCSVDVYKRQPYSNPIRCKSINSCLLYEPSLAVSPGKRSLSSRNAA